jgi:hypothetical protein
MFQEDNSGYIDFPIDNPKINSIDTGKTLVYLVVFDPIKRKYKDSKMENINLFSPGVFVSDDVMTRPPIKLNNTTLDSLIESDKEQQEYDSLYFPHFESKEELKRQMSINLVTAICIGWSNFSFELKNSIRFWNASFCNLTPEGRNLYYSIKKLHNNKEVRILTFSTN